MSYQHLIEIEFRLIVESPSDDIEDATEDFIARLTELASSDAHILGLTVNGFPLPAMRPQEPLVEAPAE